MLDFDNLNSSVILKAHYGKDYQTLTWNKSYLSDIKKLSIIINIVNITEHNSLFLFVKQTFLKFINEKKNGISNDEIEHFINVLRVFKDEIKIQPNKIIEFTASDLTWYSDLENFRLLNEIYPNEYQEFVSSDNFYYEVLPQILQNEYDSADDDNLDAVLEALFGLENEFGVSASDEIQNIQAKIDQQNYDIEHAEEIDYYQSEEYENKYYQRQQEDREIINMFNSLKYD